MLIVLFLSLCHCRLSLCDNICEYWNRSIDNSIKSFRFNLLLLSYNRAIALHLRISVPHPYIGTKRSRAHCTNIIITEWMLHLQQSIIFCIVKWLPCKLYEKFYELFPFVSINWWEFGRFIIIFFFSFFRCYWLPLVDAPLSEQIYVEEKKKKMREKKVYEKECDRWPCYVHELWTIFCLLFHFIGFPFIFVVENSLDMFCWNRFNAIVVKLDVVSWSFFCSSFSSFSLYSFSLLRFFCSLFHWCNFKINSIPIKYQSKKKLSKWIQITSKL